MGRKKNQVDPLSLHLRQVGKDSQINQQHKSTAKSHSRRGAGQQGDSPGY